MNGPRSLSSTASALLLAASVVPGLGTVMGGVSDVQSRAALPGAAVVDIALTPEPLAMDEIVVTSEAGIRRGREVGNTVARLEIDEVLDRPIVFPHGLPMRTRSARQRPRPSRACS